MRKFLSQFSKWVRITLIICIAYPIVYKLILVQFPALFPLAVQFGELFYDCSLAAIIGLVVFLLTKHYQERLEAEATMKIINSYFEIIEDFIDFYAYRPIKDKLGLSSEQNLTSENFNQYQAVELSETDIKKARKLLFLFEERTNNLFEGINSIIKFNTPNYYLLNNLIGDYRNMLKKEDVKVKIGRIWVIENMIKTLKELKKN